MGVLGLAGVPNRGGSAWKALGLAGGPEPRMGSVMGVLDSAEVPSRDRECM
ncbi:hypothetical protein Fmac_015376 [Flemingia macrophylla]|uniref:Uncharacterized protein n=1 Tax=Flemingia macrophylla TaxID=520843 RepID=A0ABD1MEE3_9FABA